MAADPELKLMQKINALEGKIIKELGRKKTDYGLIAGWASECAILAEELRKYAETSDD